MGREKEVEVILWQLDFQIGSFFGHFSNQSVIQKYFGFLYQLLHLFAMETPTKTVSPWHLVKPIPNSSGGEPNALCCLSNFIWKISLLTNQPSRICNLFWNFYAVVSYEMADWCEPQKTLESLVPNNVAALLLGEMLGFFGIFMLIATITGWNGNDFWATDIPDPRNPCPLSFSDYMSKRRFNTILCETLFTDREQPPLLDKCYVRWVADWNTNMTLQFLVGDKLMSIQTNCWTCHGWVFCPCKPHPFCNKYRTSCCGIMGILFAMEMIEGFRLSKGDWSTRLWGAW